jgi:hypothetical protein
MKQFTLTNEDVEDWMKEEREAAFLFEERRR